MLTARSVRLMQIAAFAVAMGVLARVVLNLNQPAGSVAALWPIDGLLAAFLVRWVRDRREAAATYVAVGLALVVASGARGHPLVLAVVVVSIEMAALYVTVRMLRRIGPPIESPRTLAAFIAGPVLAVPFVGSLCVASILVAFTPAAEVGPILLRWWSASALGMAIVGSLALSVGLAGVGKTLRAGWVRFGLSQAAVLAGSVVVMFVMRTPPLFVLAPLMIMGVLSHRGLGGVTTVAVMSAVAVASTFAGHGVTILSSVVQIDRVLVMQLFLAAVVFTVLPVSALLHRLDRYETELEDRRARAEELNALKSRLLAYVGHEIRSPLSGVTSLAGLMRDGVMGQLTAEQKETLAQIASTGAEVEALARDLTDAAAIEAGKATVSLAATPVGEAIRAAVNLARFRTAQYHAELLAPQGPADHLEVMADPLRLRQILVNLLVNGAKYGGSPPVVTVTARRVDGGIRFEVADNGAGIAPAQRQTLFNHFERLGAEVSAVEGSGLGLALSQEMARLQKGRLGLADTAGGACFWLELPLCGQASAGVAA